MTPLCLQVKHGDTPEMVDLTGFVPTQLESVSVEGMKAISLPTSRGPIPAGDLFDIEDGSREEVVLSGMTTNFCHVGGRMDAGRMRVQGNVGDYLANQMSGGYLTVDGDARDFAFANMRGGYARLHGNCGDNAAGAQQPMGVGMQGGLAVIEGDCGNWAATRMRRGTLVVHGDVGHGAAARMIAGSLVLCGQLAEPFAPEMKRGTVLLMAEAVPGRYPGFTEPENTELSFLPLLLKSIAPSLPEACKTKMSRVAMRSIGDRTMGGLGEVVWLNERTES